MLRLFSPEFYPIGIAQIVFGGLLLIAAFWRQRSFSRYRGPSGQNLSPTEVEGLVTEVFGRYHAAGDFIFLVFFLSVGLQISMLVVLLLI